MPPRPYKPTPLPAPGAIYQRYLPPCLSWRKVISSCSLHVKYIDLGGAQHKVAIKYWKRWVSQATFMGNEDPGVAGKDTGKVPGNGYCGVAGKDTGITQD